MKRNVMLMFVMATLLLGCSESKEDEANKNKSSRMEQTENKDRDIEANVARSGELNLGITPEEFIYLYNYELTDYGIDANLLLNQDMSNEYTEVKVETNADEKVVRIDFISHTFNINIFAVHLVKAISPQVLDKDIPDMLRFYLGLYGDSRDIEPNREFSGDFIVDNVKYEISTIDASKRKHKITISAVEES